VNPPAARARRSGPGAQFIADRRRDEREQDPLRAQLGDYLDPEEPAAAVPLNGTVEIGAVAESVGLSVRQVRGWIHDGMLPDAPFRGDARNGGRFGGKAAGRRRWPRELVTQLKVIAREEGQLSSPRRQISTTNFAQRAEALQDSYLRDHPENT
jgi:hypothetical protein